MGNAGSSSGEGGGKSSRSRSRSAKTRAASPTNESPVDTTRLASPADVAATAPVAGQGDTDERREHSPSPTTPLPDEPRQKKMSLLRRIKHVSQSRESTSTNPTATQASEKKDENKKKKKNTEKKQKQNQKQPAETPGAALLAETERNTEAQRTASPLATAGAASASSRFTNAVSRHHHHYDNDEEEGENCEGSHATHHDSSSDAHHAAEGQRKACRSPPHSLIRSADGPQGVYTVTAPSGSVLSRSPALSEDDYDNDGAAAGGAGGRESRRASRHTGSHAHPHGIAAGVGVDSTPNVSGVERTPDSSFRQPPHLTAPSSAGQLDTSLPLPNLPLPSGGGPGAVKSQSQPWWRRSPIRHRTRSSEMDEDSYQHFSPTPEAESPQHAQQHAHPLDEMAVLSAKSSATSSIPPMISVSGPAPDDDHDGDDAAVPSALASPEDHEPVSVGAEACDAQGQDQDPGEDEGSERELNESGVDVPIDTEGTTPALSEASTYKNNRDVPCDPCEQAGEAGPADRGVTHQPEELDHGVIPPLVLPNAPSSQAVAPATCSTSPTAPLPLSTDSRGPPLSHSLSLRHSRVSSSASLGTSSRASSHLHQHSSHNTPSPVHHPRVHPRRPEEAASEAEQDPNAVDARQRYAQRQQISPPQPPMTSPLTLAQYADTPPQARIPFSPRTGAAATPRSSFSTPGLAGASLKRFADNDGHRALGSAGMSATTAPGDEDDEDPPTTHYDAQRHYPKPPAQSDAEVEALYAAVPEETSIDEDWDDEEEREEEEEDDTDVNRVEEVLDDDDEEEGGEYGEEALSSRPPSKRGSELHRDGRLSTTVEGRNGQRRQASLSDSDSRPRRRRHSDKSRGGGGGGGRGLKDAATGPTTPGGGAGLGSGRDSTSALRRNIQRQLLKSTDLQSSIPSVGPILHPASPRRRTQAVPDSCEDGDRSGGQARKLVRAGYSPRAEPANAYEESLASPIDSVGTAPTIHHGGDDGGGGGGSGSATHDRPDRISSGGVGDAVIPFLLSNTPSPRSPLSGRSPLYRLAMPPLTQDGPLPMHSATATTSSASAGLEVNNLVANSNNNNNNNAFSPLLSFPAHAHRRRSPRQSASPSWVLEEGDDDDDDADADLRRPSGRRDRLHHDERPPKRNRDPGSPERLHALDSLNSEGSSRGGVPSRYEEPCKAHHLPSWERPQDVQDDQSAGSGDTEDQFDKLPAAATAKKKKKSPAPQTAQTTTARNPAHATPPLPSRPPQPSSSSAFRAAATAGPPRNAAEDKTSTDNRRMHANSSGSRSRSRTGSEPANNNSSSVDSLSRLDARQVVSVHDSEDVDEESGATPTTAVTDAGGETPFAFPFTASMEAAATTRPTSAASRPAPSRPPQGIPFVSAPQVVVPLADAPRQYARAHGIFDQGMDEGSGGEGSLRLEATSSSVKLPNASIVNWVEVPGHSSIASSTALLPMDSSPSLVLAATQTSTTTTTTAPRVATTPVSTPAVHDGVRVPLKTKYKKVPCTPMVAHRDPPPHNEHTQTEKTQELHAEVAPGPTRLTLDTTTTTATAAPSSVKAHNLPPRRTRKVERPPPPPLPALSPPPTLTAHALSQAASAEAAEGSVRTPPTPWLDPPLDEPAHTCEDNLSEAAAAADTETHSTDGARRDEAGCDHDTEGEDSVSARDPLSGRGRGSGELPPLDDTIGSVEVDEEQPWWNRSRRGPWSSFSRSLKSPHSNVFGDTDQSSGLGATVVSALAAPTLEDAVEPADHKRGSGEGAARTRAGHSDEHDDEGHHEDAVDRADARRAHRRGGSSAFSQLGSNASLLEHRHTEQFTSSLNDPQPVSDKSPRQTEEQTLANVDTPPLQDVDTTAAALPWTSSVGEDLAATVMFNAARPLVVPPPTSMLASDALVSRTRLPHTGASAMVPLTALSTEGSTSESEVRDDTVGSFTRMAVLHPSRAVLQSRSAASTPTLYTRTMSLGNMSHGDSGDGAGGLIFVEAVEVGVTPMNSGAGGIVACASGGGGGGGWSGSFSPVALKTPVFLGVSGEFPASASSSSLGVRAGHGEAMNPNTVLALEGYSALSQAGADGSAAGFPQQQHPRTESGASTSWLSLRLPPRPTDTTAAPLVDRNRQLQPTSRSPPSLPTSRGQDSSLDSTVFDAEQSRRSSLDATTREAVKGVVDREVQNRKVLEEVALSVLETERACVREVLSAAAPAPTQSAEPRASPPVADTPPSTSSATSGSFQHRHHPEANAFVGLIRGFDASQAVGGKTDATTASAGSQPPHSLPQSHSEEDKDENAHDDSADASLANPNRYDSDDTIRSDAGAVEDNEAEGGEEEGDADDDDDDDAAAVPLRMSNSRLQSPDVPTMRLLMTDMFSLTGASASTMTFGELSPSSRRPSLAPPPSSKMRADWGIRSSNETGQPHTPMLSATALTNVEGLRSSASSLGSASPRGVDATDVPLAQSSADPTPQRQETPSLPRHAAVPESCPTPPRSDPSAAGPSASPAPPPRHRLSLASVDHDALGSFTEEHLFDTGLASTKQTDDDEAHHPARDTTSEEHSQSCSVSRSTQVNGEAPLAMHPLQQQQQQQQQEQPQEQQQQQPQRLTPELPDRTVPPTSMQLATPSRTTRTHSPNHSRSPTTAANLHVHNEGVGPTGDAGAAQSLPPTTVTLATSNDQDDEAALADNAGVSEVFSTSSAAATAAAGSDGVPTSTSVRAGSVLDDLLRESSIVTVSTMTESRPRRAQDHLPAHMSHLGNPPTTAAATTVRAMNGSPSPHRPPSPSPPHTTNSEEEKHNGHTNEDPGHGSSSSPGREEDDDRRDGSAEAKPKRGPSRAVCVLCDRPYSACARCPVADQSHADLFARRKREKAAKKSAKALLAAGRVADAVSLLAAEGLVSSVLLERASPSPRRGDKDHPHLVRSPSPAATTLAEAGGRRREAPSSHSVPTPQHGATPPQPLRRRLNVDSSVDNTGRTGARVAVSQPSSYAARDEDADVVEAGEATMRTSHSYWNAPLHNQPDEARPLFLPQRRGRSYGMLSPARDDG